MYKHKPETIINSLFENVNKYPEKIALIEDDNKITYQELGQMIRKMSYLFKYKHQLSENDKIAISLKNTIMFCVSIFAVMNIGAVAIPLNNKLRHTEQVKILEKTKPKLFISDSDDLNKEMFHLFQIPVYHENLLKKI